MKMKTAMDVRRHLGALLDEVHLKSETFVIERAGKPIAMLCPVDLQERPSDKAAGQMRAVREMAGLRAISSRGRDVGRWLESERESWNAG